MTHLVRFTPAQDIRRMQSEIDRLFGNLFAASRPEDPEAETAVWAPRVDLVETPDAYLIHADLPGIIRDDVNVNYHDGVLSISGERTAQNLAEGDSCVRLERSFGRFYRSFSLPKTVDDKKISGAFADGVLTVRVPKAEESKPRRIEIA